MEFSKKISKSGSITLPAAMRRELGIDKGQRFKISLNGFGSIVLKRVQGECIFCKTDNNLLMYAGRYICNDCLLKMNQINDEGSR